MRIFHLVTVATLVLSRDSAAQDVMIGAQAIPLVTRADPTATRGALTEGYLTQPVVMAHAGWNALRAVSTLNFEGLTIERGELVTGAYGEGYVDRRHPHAFVHEMLGGVEFPRDGTSRRLPFDVSLFAGRGFAPFGSDDPMMRPFEKYPVNHHLAQVLERIVAVAAVRYGPVIGEFGTFNGDEPTGPGAPPNWKRFADSWSSRVTVLPFAHAELSGSIADVTSPEIRIGHGLDQRKTSLAARYDFNNDGASWRYAMLEWAHTDERTGGTTVNSLHSVLGEAAACRGDVIVAARVERTDRPEEELSADPFRTPRPPSDLSSLGVSRWTTATLSLSSPAVRTRYLSGRPFVEVARIGVGPGTPAGIFDATLRYGNDRLWMLSAGIRLRAGGMHDRMGRYGAALPDAVGTSNAARESMPDMPDMPDMPGMPRSTSSKSMHMNTRCRA